MIYCFDRDAIALYLDNSATFNVTEYSSTMTTTTIDGSSHDNTIIARQAAWSRSKTFVGADTIVMSSKLTDTKQVTYLY